jgi:benzoyl-CoA reductase subunit D
MIVAGIDSGALYTKTVIMNDQTVISKYITPTGTDIEKAAQCALLGAADLAGISKNEIQKKAAVGMGKSGISDVNFLVEDIQAMTRAATFFFPEARCVVDVGAEEGRVARLDGHGKIIDSAINERCAAGAGIFFESASKLLNQSIEEMGPLSLRSNTEIPLNAQCVLFAEAEILDLIRSNTPSEDISRAIHEAMAARIITLISRVGVDGNLVMMGGTAKNVGFTSLVKEKLRLTDLYIPNDPEFGAAIGAALIASESDDHS